LAPPFRATLSIVFDGRRWRPDQLEMARNQPVDKWGAEKIFEVLFKTRWGGRGNGDGLA
jgi:hypothetical protein